MNLILPTKATMLSIFCLLMLPLSHAQNTESSSKDDSIETKKSDAHQKTVIFTLGLFQPITTESSFIGRGTEGKVSFNIGVQGFVYKHFFIGVNTGASYLEVTDSSFTGNYKRSTVAHTYIEVGYEFPINKDFRLGASFAPWGEARYKNIRSRARNNEQVDHAKFTKYELYLGYNISGKLYVFAGYSFRNDNSDIQTAPEIQDDFDKIQYHQINFGLKLYFGSKNLVSDL